MATTWSGWTLSELIDQLKGLYGSGWASDNDTVSRVNRAVYSSWCMALTKFSETATTTYDPADATSQPTGFNQYFGALALFNAGLVIDAQSNATAMLWRQLLQTEPKTCEGDAIHSWSTT